MSIKTKAGQIWTDSVAYVALLAGAGLSIAGNVANVIRTRGEAVDALDIVLAVAFPALVVLMVEVFVSARWKGLGWPMQTLRWLGTLAIGAVAMRVSWVHLHELMASRGQAEDVATFGPLAIDFLAIMATALILAGRGQARPAAVAPMPIMVPAVPVAAPVIPASPIGDEMAIEARTWLDSLADVVLDDSSTAAYPISPAPMANAVKPESVPAEAADLIRAYLATDEATRPSAKDANEALSAAFSVSTRTARRWISALKATA